MVGHDFSIRDAHREDIGRLASIWHSGWHDAHAELLPLALVRARTERAMRERIERNFGDVRVIAGPAGPLGFAMVKGTELHQFYMCQAARGTGAAVVLMSDVLDVFLGTGVKKAWLACVIGNERAARFYEKSGWRRAATVTTQRETPAGSFPLDVWRYELDLDEP